MKLFNNHSGLRGLPRFAEGIYWATGSSLTTPFAEGCPGANNKPRPLAVIRNRRLNSVALLVPLRSVQFSSVQFSTYEGCEGVNYQTLPPGRSNMLYF